MESPATPPPAMLRALAEKLDPQEIERAMFKQLARRKLSVFIKAMWPHVRPGVKLVWNWHIDVMCYYLEHVSHPEYHGQEERLKRLIMNVPPGAMKSLCVGVFWPAWVWLSKPEFQFIFASYQQQLTLRDATTTHQLMELPEYQEYIDPNKRWTFDTQQDTKAFYKNTSTGYRISLSVDGGGTGYRANAVVWDDPTNITKNPTLESLMLTNDWFDNRMSTRLNEPTVDSFVGIMQRIHELDLTGWLLERDKAEKKAGNTEHIPYEVVEIPAEYKAEKPQPYDPRRIEGELFFERRFPKFVLDAYRKQLGEYSYAAQFDQNPFPAGGGIFNVSRLKLWAPRGMQLPPFPVKNKEGISVHLEILELPDADELSYHCQSWDCAFKDLESSDYVCGQVWAYAKAKFWMLHMVNEKMGITKTMQAIRQMSADYPEAWAKYIEDKANGTAVIEMLQEEILGVEAINPQGGKVSRAQAIVPFVDASDIVLAHPAICPETATLIEQMTKFPKAVHDDGVDAMSQAINKMALFSGGDYMEKLLADFTAPGASSWHLLSGFNR